MSQTVITTAFEALKAQQAATNTPVVLDEFVFANVPNLNITDPVDPAEAMPAAGQIVHRASVGKTGVVNANAVVYSVTLGADVGDFSFNWVGLRDKTSNTLAMIIHAPVQQKVKNNAGTQGNVLTRSFLMEYDGAKKETQITTPAGTWQIDFTARLAGMDERHRIENIDVYGTGAFIGDGFLVKRAGNNYSVTAGAGYVGGLRAVLAAEQALTVTTKPVKVWVDTSFTGTLTSVWQVSTEVSVADTLADYVKNDVNHYVFAVAQINSDGSVTDLRKIGSDVDDRLAKHISALNPHPQYAFKHSPELTGIPTAPTPQQNDNSLQIANTAFVKELIASLVNSSPAALDTLNELATALGNDPNFATTITNALAGKQPKDATLTNLSGKDIAGLLVYLGLSDVLHLGNYGVGGATRESAAQRTHVGSFFYEPGISGSTLYPLSVAIVESGGPTQQEWGQLAISYGSAFKAWLGRQTYNGQVETSELFHDKRKPTNEDVGSYPISGGILNGNMRATGDMTSGNGKDISSGQDIWATRDIYAQRNLNVTGSTFIGSDLTVDKNLGVHGNMDATGYIKSGTGHDVVSSQDIWASRYIYENGVRLYGPNNPPPARFSSNLGAISWEKNLETGVITQFGFINLSDNDYVTINLPIAFPTAFKSLVITPAVPGRIYGSDITAAGGKIIDNGSFAAGLSSNYDTQWTGAYFEAKGH